MKKEQRLRHFRIFLALLLIGFVLPLSTQAKDTQKLLGTFGAWRAYSSNDNNHPACYMALAPRFPSTKRLKRGPAYLMITHRPSEGSTDVISYAPGYNFKDGSDATASFGKIQFGLFTQGATAWTRDVHSDHALAAAIRANSDMIFTGTPAAKGAKPVTDKLNLKGAVDAYRAIGKACGVKTDVPTKVKPVTAKKKS